MSNTYAPPYYCKWKDCRSAEEKLAFQLLEDLLAHIKRHCAESKPVFRATYESQESYESGSHLPPRVQQLRAAPRATPQDSQNTNEPGDGTSFIHNTGPSLSPSLERALDSPHQDELPPPELSAPPASIPYVQSQPEPEEVEQLFNSFIAEPSEEVQTEHSAVQIESGSSKNADAGTAPLQRDGVFAFNFSQDPNALQGSPRRQDANDESMLDVVFEGKEAQEFGIHASQNLDPDAFTQV